MNTTAAQALQECEQITKQAARNFYYGIRLLPGHKRQALCAVYALARRIDDVGDGDLPPQEKSGRLAVLRRQLDSGETGGDPVLLAVADTARRMPIPMGAFGELIDGVEMDLAGTRYASFEELLGYCRCVAGSIGRLCLGVFGSRAHPQASERADALGIALQQTNILRDIREDLQSDRVYLPQQELDRFGVELGLDETGRLRDPDGGLHAMIEHDCLRAQRWYAQGMKLPPLLDWRSAASCRAMAGIYRQLLSQIQRRPELVYDRRLSLPGWQKTGVALRALTGVGS